MESQKYSSPPPKPPRRRHSDQLMISSSGTFVPSRKKYVDENFGRKDNISEDDFSNSGCDSLPASWAAGFLKFQEDKEPSGYKFSLEHLEVSDENTTLVDNCVFSKCRARLSEGKKAMNVKNIDSKFEVEVKYFPHILKRDKVSSQFNTDHVSSAMKKSKCGKHLSLKNKTDVLKSLQKDFHRRHHSDPVISCFDGSATRSNPSKSLKSDSFMGYASSENFTKECHSVSSCPSCKETHCLYEEIKILKEINNKLWLHLCSLQASVENLQLKSPRNVNSLSVSELFSSLYYAQKAKDSAMEERLKIAVEDRDSALLELEEMIEILERSFEDIASVKGKEKIGHKKIQELLHEIETTCNPSKLIQHQKLLLTELYNSWETKQDNLLHDFKFIVTERDNLLEKVQKLEEELETSKLCIDMWQLDNKQWENSLLDILCHIIQQRDSLLLKPIRSQSIDSSCFRSPYLKMSRSRQDYINADYKTSWKLEDSKFFDKSCHLSHEEDGVCSQFLAPSSDEIKVLKGEIVVLNKALEDEIEKRETMEDKCLRLERLVNVLRKKINGQEVGILV